MRLNGDVAEVFAAWARERYPDRAERILARIRDCHGGKVNDSRWHDRQRGTGVFADMIAHRIRLARRRLLPSGDGDGDTRADLPDYTLALFDRYRPGQKRLF